MKNIILILVVIVLFSCDGKISIKQNSVQDKISVITVNYPLYYFADRIAGDLVNLQYIIPKDVDPAYWIPNEKELEVYQSSDIIVINGANYAKWMDDVSLPSSRIVNTAATFESELILLKNLASHNHGPEGEHEHGGFAFTTWLDFKLALKQAEAVRAILVNKLPTEKLKINKNFEALKSELESLDREMISSASNLKEFNLLGSHPVYQYLSKGYNLTIQSVHFEPNETPTKKQWEPLVPLISESKTNLMFWENSPLQEIESKLLEFKINGTVFNPCGNKPENGDFLSVMKSNINSLKTK
jgi:zinc transport system substrate-binding protein